MLFLGAVSSGSAWAQRTMQGQSFLSADCLSDFDRLGAKIAFGQYTLGGFWETGANAHFYDAVTNTGYSLEYMHTYASGGYMFRLAQTRKRSINLYTGGGVFFGCEILDPLGKLPREIVFNGNRSEFLYGIYAGLSSEFFVTERLSLLIDAFVPLNFSSRIRLLNYDVGLGLKVML